MLSAARVARRTPVESKSKRMLKLPGHITAPPITLPPSSREAAFSETKNIGASILCAREPRLLSSTLRPRVKRSSESPDS